MMHDKAGQATDDHGRQGLYGRGDVVAVHEAGFDGGTEAGLPTYAILNVVDANEDDVNELVEPEERRGRVIRLRIPQDEITPDWQPPVEDLEDVYEWVIRKTNRQGLTRVVVFLRAPETRRALRVDLSTWPNIETTGEVNVLLSELEAALTRKRGGTRGRAAREAVREERRAKREMRRALRQARQDARREARQ